ncbi:hypothetical protein M758_UG280600 [Ceratodon purpureus]|nr:hypothetical protein M758_UG280600 [Ceratodon purpureus]
MNSFHHCPPLSPPHSFHPSCNPLLLSRCLSLLQIRNPSTHSISNPLCPRNSHPHQPRQRRSWRTPHRPHWTFRPFAASTSTSPLLNSLSRQPQPLSSSVRTSS